MAVSGPPVTTYDDGFPKAHPSLPPSTRRSGRRGVHRRTLVELTDDHGRTQASVENLATRVVDPTVSTAERAGGAGGALGNPSTYVVTGVPAPDRRAEGQTVRSDFPRPHPPHPPGGSGRLGRHSFELRHYGRRETPRASGGGGGRPEPRCAQGRCRGASRLRRDAPSVGGFGGRPEP